MLSLKVKSDLADFDGAMRRTGNLSGAMRVIGSLLRNETLRNFREGGRFPSHWLPSQRVAQHGGQTLIKRSILRNSIHTASGANWAAVGTDVKYAAIHQNGGQAGRHHSATIPARPFLPISATGELSPETTTRIREIIGNWITKGTAQ